MKVLKESVVAIVGMGLMGGSLALALRSRGACKKILAVERKSDALLVLAPLLADDVSAELDLVAGADVIVLATPVKTIIKLLPHIGRIAQKGAVIIDVGSTKREIIKAMEELPIWLEPVGGHPMCGKEELGLAAAEASLYENSVFALVPLERTSAEALDLAKSLVTSIGARPLLLEPKRHDWAVAATSHLPYLLASTLMATASDLSRSDDVVQRLAGPGMRDTSRLAASDTAMMMDILMTNRDMIIPLLHSTLRQMEKIATWIESEDWELLQTFLNDSAKQRRTSFHERSG